MLRLFHHHQPSWTKPTALSSSMRATVWLRAGCCHLYSSHARSWWAEACCFLGAGLSKGAGVLACFAVRIVCPLSIC